MKELAKKLFAQRGTTIHEWYVQQLAEEAGCMDLDEAREEVFHLWVDRIKPGDAWEYLFRLAKDEDALRWLIFPHIVQYDEDPEELMS